MTGGRRRPALPSVSLPGLAAPRVQVALGRAVPGTVVRVLPAVTVTLAGWLAGVDGVGWVVLAGLVAVLVLRPALPTTAGVVLLVGIATLAGPDLLTPPGPVDAGTGGLAGALAGVAGPLRLGLLVLVLDATARTAALAPNIGWTARVELAVLAGLGRSVLHTQAVAQPVLWLAHGWRAGGPDVAAGEAWRLLGLVAVVALLTLLVTRSDPPPGPGS